MKKFIGLLLVLGVMVLLPMGANAAGFKTKTDCQNDCKTPDAEGYCYTTCVVKIVDNTATLDEIPLTINFKSADKVEIVSTEGKGGWMNMGEKGSTKLSLMNTEKVTAANFELVSFKIKHASDVDCGFKIDLGDVTETVTVTTVTTTTTGATLPLVIIGCGAVAAVGIYLASNKNKKMYKI